MHGKGLQNWTDDDLDLSGIFARGEPAGFLKASSVEQAEEDTETYLPHAYDTLSQPGSRYTTTGMHMDAPAPSSISPSPSRLMCTTRCILPSLDSAGASISPEKDADALRIKALEERLERAEAEARGLRDRHEQLSICSPQETAEGHGASMPLALTAPPPQRGNGGGAGFPGGSVPNVVPAVRRDGGGGGGGAGSIPRARVVASMDIPLSVYQRARLYQRSAPSAFTSASSSPFYGQRSSVPPRTSDTSHLVPFVP